jgi:hypothetical protein
MYSESQIIVMHIYIKEKNDEKGCFVFSGRGDHFNDGRM